MAADGAELRWRIPTSGDPRLLRLAFAQIGLGTIVCALVLLVAAPREWLGPALLALGPLAVFLAFRQWRRHQQLLAGVDNVRIDAGGLHWLDHADQERTFARGDVVGFRIGSEADTLRTVPALTLYLAGGFQSQPIELHPPASVEEVRRLLGGSWGIGERKLDTSESSATLPYDLAIDVYSECHEEFHEWHFEGTETALGELFREIHRASRELPAAPPGARPLERVLLARRREASQLSIQHDHLPRIDHDTIAGPADLLAQLSQLGAAALAKRAGREDLSFDLALSPTSRWTFHLHIREP